MSPAKSPSPTGFLLDRQTTVLTPTAQMSTVWRPTNHSLLSTPPFTTHPRPKLFSCPLLLSMFVFLSMISIWLGHVLHVIHSVIFHLAASLLFFLLTLHLPMSPESFWFNSFFFPFPPVLCLPSLLLSVCSMVSLCFRPSQVWTMKYLWVPYDKTPPSAAV